MSYYDRYEASWSRQHKRHFIQGAIVDGEEKIQWVNSDTNECKPAKTFRAAQLAISKYEREKWHGR